MAATLVVIELVIDMGDLLFAWQFLSQGVKARSTDQLMYIAFQYIALLAADATHQATPMHPGHGGGGTI